MDTRLISHFYTSTTICINESASLSEAIKIIMTNSLRHLPVVDSNNIVVGIISDRDILPLIRVLGEDSTPLEKTGVNEVMTKDVQVVSPDETLSEAAEMMISGEFHALPVVENQKLSGIITSTDLLRAMVEEEGDLRLSLENAILQNRENNEG